MRVTTAAVPSEIARRRFGTPQPAVGVLAPVGEDDPADRHRLRVDAAGGERRVAGREVERRDGDRAEPDRRARTRP